MGTPLARALLPEPLRDRLRRLALPDAGHGFDVLGMSRAWVEAALVITRLPYETWFRVTGHDRHHVPAAGAAILASNHSGMLPLDALMLWTDVVRGLDPPRVPRVAVDHFVPSLPGINTMFSRAGAVSGSRGNCRYLLEQGELLVLFPEGVPGIAKGFSRRYRLQPWRVGHAELALAYRVPVVPVAVIGAEEAWPQLMRLPVHAFGAPHVPLPATPLPLPAHFHIHYGAPLRLHERFPAERADDPAVAAAAAAVVREAVAGLIERGLEEREGVFR